MQPTTAEAAFQRPLIRTGDVVLWSHGGNPEETRSPAFVTNVGDRTIQLSVFSAAHGQAKTKDGVYHLDDPLRKKGNRGDNGCWEYAPLTIYFQAIVQDFEALLERFHRLNIKVDKLSSRMSKITKDLGAEEESQTEEPATVG